MGRFPCFLGHHQEAMVYQNCIDVDDLNSVMDGYFTFRYLLPGEEPNEEPENVNEIDPSLLFKVHVNPI